MAGAALMEKNDTEKSFARKLYVLANQMSQLRETAEWKAWENVPARRSGRFLADLAEWVRSLVPERRRGIQKGKGRAPEYSEPGQLLDQFIGSISQKNAVIFLRRYWYMDTIPEIAQRCSLSEGRVRSRLRRTQGKLHVFLEREGVYL